MSGSQWPTIYQLVYIVIRYSKEITNLKVPIGTNQGENKIDNPA
jgi:hypothetical protein